jgi:glycosyltransferase involved in cell wall biosynthesis
LPKLLKINTYHYRRGGSDVVYLEHAALMGARGWSTAYFAMHHPKNEPCEWSPYFVNELEFGQAYSLRAKLAMASKVVYSFEAQHKLRSLLAAFHPDVAHLHCIYHHLSPAILPVLREQGVPAVMTAHDLKIACPAYKMLNRTGVCERCKGGNLTHVVLNRCVRDSLAASLIVAVESTLHRCLDTYRKHLDAVVVPSRFFEKKLIEWGWPQEKFCYIPNYIDATLFEPRFEPGGYFLYFGRLAPEKGVATLMRAAVSAKVSLKIAGLGPEEASLKALQQSLGGDIDFMGFQSGQALHDLIQSARAVVLPSEWYENAPMSVLESFAFGKPVLGANIGGIPELVVNGVSGWTFASRDVAELADLLQRVNTLPQAEVAELGRSARAWVEENFHRRGYEQSMLGLYADLGVKV